jgi:hypothetical protein
LINFFIVLLIFLSIKILIVFIIIWSSFFDQVLATSTRILTVIVLLWIIIVRTILSIRIIRLSLHRLFYGVVCILLFYQVLNLLRQIHAEPILINLFLYFSFSEDIKLLNLRLLIVQIFILVHFSIKVYKIFFLNINNFVMNSIFIFDLITLRIKPNFIEFLLSGLFLICLDILLCQI